MLKDVGECQETTLMGWNTPQMLGDIGVAKPLNLISKAKNGLQEFVVVLFISNFRELRGCTLAERECTLRDILAVEVVYSRCANVFIL